MSHIHFVAAEEYRQRVIQLGEDPDRVFLVGALGIDGMSHLSLLDKDALETKLDFKFAQKNLLITFHPTTLENATSREQMQALLLALSMLEDTNFIFTMPNADTDGRVIIQLIEKFVAEHANARAYASLGQLNYFSCLQFVDGVVGNSSSALIEVPCFKKGAINIGDRQRGRLKAGSVIDCEPTQQSITLAIDKLYSKEFQLGLEGISNPYGSGGASGKIVQILRQYSLESVLKKSFYDLHH
jgi:GDP/UDP-N,N'-diacetylbacillosamine 2-epimerase (hydrolysing)